MNRNDFDPISAIRRDNVHDEPKGEEAAPPKKNEEEKRLPFFAALIIWIVLGALLICLLYNIFVHPIDRLKLALALGGSCEISIVAENGFGKEEATLKVRGKYFSVTSDGKETFYELDGNIVYTYEPLENGEWKRKPVAGGSFAGGLGNDSLLNRKNYERVPGAGSVWRVKDGIDTGDADEVIFQRKGGKYQIVSREGTAVGNVTYYTTTTVTFEKIGGVRVTPPWAE
jgi:hypothetical protein